MLNLDRLSKSSSEENTRLFTEEEIENFYKNFVGDISEKPETEQQLFQLQKKYLTTRDMKYWNDMLLICFNYFKSCLLKTITGSKFIEHEKVLDASVHAAISFMTQYLKNKNFIVGASFAGMATWKIFEGKRLIAESPGNEVSLNSIIDEASHKELNDIISDDSYVSEFDDFREPLFDVFKRVMNELRDVGALDSRTYLLVNFYLLLNFRGPKNRHSIPMFLNTWASDYVTKSVCEETLLEINKRMRYECT